MIIDNPRILPLGATWTGTGTTFVAVSAVADRIELCVFDGGQERRIAMDRMSEDRHVTHLDGVGPGTAYGFRVHGPWDPPTGHRCNPRKLLLDPWARRIDGHIRSGAPLLGHDPAEPMRPSRIDSAPATMRSVVIDPTFDWGPDQPLRRSLADTVIYETHVKGLTMRHPDVPDELRGTYAGVAHPAVIDHLVHLGVTAVELLPIHQFVQDQHLLDAGRRNYWGYNSIGFFAPHNEYVATDDPVREFKGMVRLLHEAGIEVILDVVYNHTAEGNHLGPTLSFRGFDNEAWYRLDPTNQAHYRNWTGTGNTIDMRYPMALQMVMDSLRYWVEEMHVDGFRFDLATVLGRTHEGFDPLGGFFGAVSQDPVLAGVKMIAEPWDVGPGGYQVGGFPHGWSEWNDSYRDTVRDFWRDRDRVTPALATKLTGSADLYAGSGRRPTASINLITSHDGFTLADLVSYNHRHNQANGENNRDGHHDNRSWNSGVEGPTTDKTVRDLRDRRTRAMLTTLLLSQGVPMLLGGDEMGRTQQGNNNAYNQDNEISWFDWKSADDDLVDYTSSVIALRAAHPTFRRTAWLHEHNGVSEASGLDHVEWFGDDGERISSERWQDPGLRVMVLYLDGTVVHCSEGSVTDDDFLLVFNARPEAASIVFPQELASGTWTVAVDSATPHLAGTDAPTTQLTLPGFSVRVLRRQRG